MEIYHMIRESDHSAVIFVLYPPIGDVQTYELRTVVLDYERFPRSRSSIRLVSSSFRASSIEEATVELDRATGEYETLGFAAEQA